MFEKGIEYMQQQLHEVGEFESQVSQMLDLLDHEYGNRKRDSEIDIPPALTETYRRCVVRSRGIPAIRELAEWAVRVLGGNLPDEAVVQLYAAYKALADGAERDTFNALELAAMAIVRDINYGQLTLSEVAAAACLISKLVALADHVVAGITSDLSVRTNILVATDKLWDLARGEGALNDLVALLARFFFLRRKSLGQPATVSANQLWTQHLQARHSGDLPGFVLAIWAAINGHLVTLGDKLVAALDAMTAERENKRILIEAELQASN
jgi:hypothetical protein